MVSARLKLVLLGQCASLVASGGMWPLPSSHTLDPSGAIVGLNSGAFTFLIGGQDSTILQQAIARCGHMVSGTSSAAPPSIPAQPPGAAQITVMNVTVLSADTSLTLDTLDNYTLTIPAAGGTATIVASTVYGAMYGLERFSQLVDYTGNADVFSAPAIVVNDKPRFNHRGGMLDTSRHFISLPSVKMFIDALAYNFMNVFHWHMTDDEAFPYYSVAFPALSGQGAWGAPSMSHVYTPAQITEVLGYAAARGVRVLVEFDTPGHTSSWFAQPGLLTPCYTGGKPDGTYGPIDPTVEANWDFLSTLFKEVAALFPDQYIHLGGDEVAFDCWQSNPNIAAWMKSQGMNNNYTLLESYYEGRLINIVESLNKSYVVWEEIFDNGLKIKPDTVVDAWKGTAANGYDEMARVTAAGYRTIMSAGWYTNYYAKRDWQVYYETDPTNFSGSPAQHALVQGGEFSQWDNYDSETTSFGMAWARGSSVAEVLWTPQALRNNLTDAGLRLHAQECRMVARGMNPRYAYGEPNGGSFCPFEYVYPYNPPFPLNDVVPAAAGAHVGDGASSEIRALRRHIAELERELLLLRKTSS